MSDLERVRRMYVAAMFDGSIGTLALLPTDIVRARTFSKHSPFPIDARLQSYLHRYKIESFIVSVPGRGRAKDNEALCGLRSVLVSCDVSGFELTADDVQEIEHATKCHIGLPWKDQDYTTRTVIRLYAAHLAAMREDLPFGLPMRFDNAFKDRLVQLASEQVVGMQKKIDEQSLAMAVLEAQLVKSFN